jgi:hypothetical protein
MKDTSAISKKNNYTYKEFLGVLSHLGFQDESSENEYRMVHKQHKSLVVLPFRPLGDTVLNDFLTNYAYQLYMQGIIKKEEDILQIMEKSRKKSLLH